MLPESHVAEEETVQAEQTEETDETIQASAIHHMTEADYAER